MLTADQLEAASGTVQTLQLVGTVDLPPHADGSIAGQIATAMDISEDGKRTLILTYHDVFEWDQDLSAPFDSGRPLEAGRHYVLTPIAPLPQAEAVAYIPDEGGILYTTEAPSGATEVPLYRQTCARR